MAALRLGALCIAAAAVGLAQNPALPPDIESVVAGIAPVEDDAKIIERTRRIALAYTDNLPNFICTQENRKFKDESWDGSGWQQYSDAVAEVRFIDKTESYRTIAVDGRPSDEDFTIVSGESGTFGTRLLTMFLPESKAAFRRTTDAVIEGRDAYVFEVLLPKENLEGGVMSLGWYSSGLPIWQIAVGSRGLVSIEQETGNVLRIDRLETLGFPVSYPVHQARYRVDYNYVPISDDTFLLPVRAQYFYHLAPPLMHKYDVSWRDCRKFGAESVLTFEKSTVEDKDEAPN